MAYPNDASRIGDQIAALAASDRYFTNNTKQAGRRLIRRTYQFAPMAATNANGSNAVLANANNCIRLPVAGRILAAYGVADTAATAAATNNATIAVLPLNATTGVSGTALATITTNTSANAGTGNVVVGVPFTIPAAAGDTARYAANTVIAPQVSMNGSGVAMGKVSVTIDVEEEDVLDSYPV